MAMDFVTIDWETANEHRASPCAIGLVVVRDGEIAESWSTLMRPPRGHGSFSTRNTTVHGLCADDIVSAPRFVDVWPQIEDRLVGLPVFAHNATFDMSVIQEATSAADLPCPALRFGCTLVLARQHYVLPSYTLDAVATVADVPLDHHHDALSDALAAAGVLVTIAGETQVADLEDLFDLYRVSWGRLDSAGLVRCGADGPSARQRAGGRDVGDPREQALEMPPTLW